MTIKFSESLQTHYETNLNYPDLPNDLVDVTSEQHHKNLIALDAGYHVFSDLSLSRTKKLSSFHKWNGSEWIDNRTVEQIAEYERSLLSPLTKRQFSLYLYDIGKYEQVMGALNANPRFKIEFETVATIERSSSTVAAMGKILEWNDLTIDTKWKEALKL